MFEERLFKPSVTPPRHGSSTTSGGLATGTRDGRSSLWSPSGARPLLALEPQEGCWTKEFKAYLLQGTLPEKEEDTERVARQATAYCIKDGELYHRRPNDISLWCISREQGLELLADIHGGDCGHHSSSRTLIGMAFHSGFY